MYKTWNKLYLGNPYLCFFCSKLWIKWTKHTHTCISTFHLFFSCTSFFTFPLLKKQWENCHCLLVTKMLITWYIEEVKTCRQLPNHSSLSQFLNGFFTIFIVDKNCSQTARKACHFLCMVMELWELMRWMECGEVKSVQKQAQGNISYFHFLWTWILTFRNIFVWVIFSGTLWTKKPTFHLEILKSRKGRAVFQSPWHTLYCICCLNSPASPSVCVPCGQSTSLSLHIRTSTKATYKPHCYFLYVDNMLQCGHTEQKDIGAYCYKQPVSVKWM